MKQLALKRLAFLSISISTVFLSYVYAADTTSDTFVSQSSSGLGSNNSVISTEFFARPSGSGAYYMNRGNNSSVIGNYFEGFYYDSILGYFELDWSNNLNENVRIISSTGICSGSYGYKLGGYAYSPAYGYMDFDYNDDTFVYYCEEDRFLRGHAYNVFSGFQNFEGIAFDIGADSDAPVQESTTDNVFVSSGTPQNNDSISGDSSTPNSNPGSSRVDNSNFTRNTIQNSGFEFDPRAESSFFIIK